MSIRIEECEEVAVALPWSLKKCYPLCTLASGDQKEDIWIAWNPVHARVRHLPCLAVMHYRLKNIPILFSWKRCKGEVHQRWRDRALQNLLRLHWTSTCEGFLFSSTGRDIRWVDGREETACTCSPSVFLKWSKSKISENSLSTTGKVNDQQTQVVEEIIPICFDISKLVILVL